jgi:hypothetical protein
VNIKQMFTRFTGFIYKRADIFVDYDHVTNMDFMIFVEPNTKF